MSHHALGPFGGPTYNVVERWLVLLMVPAVTCQVPLSKAANYTLTLIKW